MRTPITLRPAHLLALAAVLVLALASSGCAGASSPEGASVPPESQATTPPQTPEEEPLYTPSYQPKGDEVAVIKTPKGTIEFELYPEDAPNHVASFIELAKKGFYNGTTFHRVEAGFVVQGGDPYSKTGEGPVGSGGPGYRLKAEFNDRKHLEGTVAMARSTDPDSAGSQFYICLGPQPSLDGKYTVFGQVTKDMDVVRTIAIGDVMESVTIEQRSN